MAKTLLIVDDIRSNREILRNMLSGEYDIAEASNGEEALRLLLENYDTISAVLLDISMPGLNGYEVLQKMRSNALLAPVPVIMITSSENEEARVKALSHGANDFVMKPYSSEILRHCLHNNIAFHEAKATVDALRRDNVTGLYNREAFFEQVKRAVFRHEPGYYVMTRFDIDKFKVINDQYGTEKGNEVLRHVAETFARGFEPCGGICCRVSADNFAVLYPASFRNSDEIAAIRRTASLIEWLPSPLVFSIGRYIVDDISLPPSAMYDRATLAAGTVKGRYGDKIAMYDEKMREQLIREQKIVTEMAAALKNRQFEVWFQPQYNHATNAQIGAEALVRWRHPEGGLIPPNDFIPIFEKNGFIYEMDKFVWEEVCRYLRGWLDEGRNPLPVSVNISRYDVLRPDLIETVTELVASYDLPRDLLRLEVTESAFSESAEQIVSVVKELIDLGFTVEIDDFGSGYSSLNTLKEVPAQIVKLDMRFFNSDGDSQRGGSIVESVVRMAKWLGMSVIAEGVEKKEQADYLRSIGCNYIQGYFYAKPMPAEEYEEHCKGTRKEEHMLALETVEHLDNDAFWDAGSMDSLIFNSFVGAACIFELDDDEIEAIRATERFANMISDGAMSVEDALKLDWARYLDEDNKKLFRDAVLQSKKTNADSTVELVFDGLPDCTEKTFIRSTMRVIATVGKRFVVYCLVENVTERREAQRKMREAAAEIQMIMDDMPGGLVRMCVEGDGRIAPIYFSKGFISLVGMSYDELMELYANDAMAGVHPDDMEIVNRAVSEMMEYGEARSSRYRLMHGNGGYIWLIFFGRSTKDENGQTFLNIYYSDATKEVQVEEQSKKLLDNLPYGAALYEYDGTALKVLHLNKKYWTLVNRKPNKYSDLSFVNAVHPDDRLLISDALNTALKEHRPLDMNMRVLYGESEYRLFHVTANMEPQEDGQHLIYAAYEPIDPDTLSYRQALPLVLAAVMNSTSDFAFAKDKDFRYLSASPAFLRLAQLDNELEVVGKTDFDIFPKDMAEEFRKNDVFLFESGKSLVDFDETIHSPDGTTHYCRASKYPLLDTTGQLVGLYGVSRDIGKERDALEKLRLINDTVPGGIATYTVRNGVLSISYCNGGFCELFGGTPEGFARRGEFDPVEWVVEEDRPELLRQVDALVKDGTPIDIIIRIYTVDGGIKWVNQKATVAERYGDMVLFNSLLLDVTERQRMNEQLRISQEENALAVQHSGNIVCRFDIAEKTLTMGAANAKAQNAPPVLDDFPHDPVRKGLISPETADAFIGFFDAICKGNKAGSVLYQQKYFGEWHWTEAKSSTVFAADGTPVKAVISMCDVTEKIEKENIYRKWQQSLDNRAPGSYTLFRTNISHVDAYDIKEGTLLTFDFDSAGVDPNEVAKAYASKCIHAQDRDKYIAFINVDTMLASYFRGKRSDFIEYRELLPGGDVRWLRLTVDLVEFPNSTDVEAYMMFEDIDESKKAELKRQELSETDPLTKVLNRTTFTARVNRILRASKPEMRHALLMLDIDGFKQVNDAFGHGAGDRTLIEIAEGLRAIIRADDLVARLGGDEFVIFLTNVMNTDSVITKAKQMRSIVRKSFSMEVRISASIGVALSPYDGMDFETLYKKADSALYYVKGSGKDNQAIYSEEMADEHLQPEVDTFEDDGKRLAEKKRRMLIVDDNSIDHILMENIFRNEFIIEKAKDGNTALIRLRHYGSAISVVLLDLMMPGMDGFAVLEKMQESAELRSIPVIVVSGDESRETCLTAIRKGATDFVTKPVDVDVLRVRVHSAVSKAENERLRAKNSLLEYQNNELDRYKAAMESGGVVVVEIDWIAGTFLYDSTIGEHIAGRYDARSFWGILLSDLVAETATVQMMQDLVQKAAAAHEQQTARTVVRLKTPEGEHHRFRMSIMKKTDEFGLTAKLYMTFVDLGADSADD